MPEATPSQAIRIAIALAALKHKPTTTSTHQYALDLQSKFHLSSFELEQQDDPLRRRVAELEATLRETQDVCQSEHIELLALRAAVSVAKDVTALPTPPPTLPPSSKKKRPKKSTAAATTASNMPSELSDSRVSSIGKDMAHTRTTEPGALLIAPLIHACSSSLPADLIACCIPKPYLFPALHTLDALSTLLQQDASARPPPSILVATGCHCIEALGRLLDSILTPQAPSVGPSAASAIAAIMHILPHILRTVLPPLLRAYGPSGRPKSTHWPDESHPDITRSLPRPAWMEDDLSCALDAMFGSLTSLVLVPCVQALASLASSRTHLTLGGPPTSRKPTSLPAARTQSDPQATDHTALIRLLHLALSTVTELSTEAQPPTSKRDRVLVSSIHALHDRLALEGLREILKLFSARPVDQSSGSWTSRLTLLAQKDALHVLCSAVSPCLVRAESGCGTPFLREALGHALGDVVRQREGLRLDEAEDELILAVVERAWEAGVLMGGEGQWEYDEDEQDVTMGEG